MFNFFMKKKANYLPLLFAVAFAYFAFGAITNVAGAIIPKIRDTYEVSSSLSSLLAAVFFIAYGLTSIPWGMLMDKIGKRQTLIWSSVITTLGVALFAAVPGFSINMLSMFLCGLGITGIQVALNPLVNEISEPAKYSRNLTLFMVVNGLGGYLAPQIVTVIKNQNLDWTATYWVFTVISLVMLLAISLPEYPKDSKDKKKSAKAKSRTLELLSSKPLIYAYALGIFLYVGVEVGVANTIAFLLEDKFKITEFFAGTDNAGSRGPVLDLYISLLTTLGQSDNLVEGIKNLVISNYWGGLLVGRLIGSAVLDRISGRKAIMIYIAFAAASLYMALQGGLEQALWVLPLVGFFISIMFPTIYSMATHSFSKDYSSAISGILCTAIIGGAAIGPLIAKIAEISQGADAVPNWDTGLLLAFACYAYIFCLATLCPGIIKCP
jgi:fucose permease